MLKIKYTHQNIYDILNDNPHGVDWKKKTYSMFVPTKEEKLLKEKKLLLLKLRKENRLKSITDVTINKDRVCSKCNKHIGIDNAKNALDRKFHNRYGMCFDCAIDILSKFQALNIWNSYLQTYMLANMISVIRDSIQWYELLRLWDGVQQTINSLGLVTDTFEDPLNILLYKRRIDIILDLLKLYKQVKIQLYLEHKKFFLLNFDLYQQEGKLDKDLKSPVGRDLLPDQFDKKFEYTAHLLQKGDKINSELEKKENTAEKKSG